MVKTNVMRILDSKKISYDVYSYEAKEALDGVTVAGKIGEDVSFVYKTLVTTNGKNAYFVFVIPAEKELDLKKAASSSGNKQISMLPLSKLTDITGYVRGGCSPVGMKKKFPVYLDSSAETLPYVVVSGGKIGLQVKLAPSDLQKVTDLKFSDLTKN